MFNTLIKSIINKRMNLDSWPKHERTRIIIKQTNVSPLSRIRKLNVKTVSYAKKIKIFRNK